MQTRQARAGVAAGLVVVAGALFERAGTRHQLGDDEGAQADARRSCELGFIESCHRAWRLGVEWSP